MIAAEDEEGLMWLCGDRLNFLLFVMQGLPECSRCDECFFFFFLIADVKSKLFFFKTNSTKELREHNFFYTSKSKRAGLSFRATNNEGQFPFHKFCVSPNSPANEVFPGFFKVKSNELFHHEATAVSDGNSWPNTYSCWDRSSQFSPFMTKL